MSHELHITPAPMAQMEFDGSCSCGDWAYRAGGVTGPRRIGEAHDRHLEEVDEPCTSSSES